MNSFFKVASKRQWISIVAALVAGTCVVSTAQAGVDFCNNYQVPVFISVAYQENGAWVSRGWEKIDSGACRADPFDIQVGHFYFRGETDLFPTASGRMQQATWGNRETTRFSVVNDGFDFLDAEVAHRGARLEGFVASASNLAGNSETITFGADLSLIQKTRPSSN
jgi:uncharacterized membrane protein